MEKLRHELPEFYRQQRYLSSQNALAILLEKAFFHLHNNYPIFHRPTMQLESFPTYLTLAIASLGALLSDDHDTQHFGLTLHNYVRDFIFSVLLRFSLLMIAYYVFWKSRDLGFADNAFTQCYGKSPRQTNGP